MTFRNNKTVRQFTLSTPSMKESWDMQKTKLKKKYPILTDSDLRYDEGKKGAMWENLKIKLGLSKEELQKLISRV
ncbi:MAG: hypothetical protein A3J84_03050 [Ignavibacteria bacterium RIFOXYA2_FULL_37_17]|nr:MAG: hypothetical protein A3J84_03050 [Ignavibacteria bacterium RIFOXYA2_FULL_37_17]